MYLNKMVITTSNGGLEIGLDFRADTDTRNSELHNVFYIQSELDSCPLC